MVKPDKSRYVWLYLPSKADKERWQAMADKARGMVLGGLIPLESGG